MNLRNLSPKPRLAVALALATLSTGIRLAAQQPVDFSDYTAPYSFTTGEEIADSSGEFVAHFGRPEWATVGAASATVEDLGDGNRLILSTADGNNAFSYVDGPAFDPTDGQDVQVRTATFRIANVGAGRAYFGLYAGSVANSDGHDFRDLGDIANPSQAAAGLGLMMLGDTFRVVRTGPSNSVQYWNNDNATWADGSGPSGVTFSSGTTYTATVMVDRATGALALSVFDEDAGSDSILSASSSLTDTGSQGANGGLHFIFGEPARNNGHSWSFEVSELLATTASSEESESTVLDFSDYSPPYSPASGETIQGSEDNLIFNHGRRADLTTGSGSTNIENSGDGNRLVLQTAEHNGAYAYLTSPVFETTSSKTFGANFRFAAIGNSRAFFGLYDGAISSSTGYNFQQLSEAGADTHIGIGLVFHGTALRLVRTGPDNTIQTWIPSSGTWVDGYTNSGPSYEANVNYAVTASLDSDTGELTLRITDSDTDTELLNATSNLSETGSQGASGGLHLVFGEPSYNAANGWILEVSELTLGAAPSEGGGDEGGDGEGSIEPSDPALFAAGFVNVRDYGALGDDELDDTEAIRAAIADAYSDSINDLRAVYFPTGTYLISDTIEVRRPASADMASWRPSHMLIGARERPTIKLSPNAQGFSNPANPKPMFFILGEWRNQPGRERIGDHFNTLFRQFILDTGVGNSGTIGVDFAAAEGCSLTDVTVFTSDPASTFFAGATGIPGSGGSVTGFEVLGGSYGIYSPEFDTSGTVITVAASRFIGQTASAIFYRSYTPMTVVGFEIQKETGPVFEFQSSGHECSANVSLIDGTIELTNPTAGSGSVGVSHVERNIVLRNVYVKGLEAIVSEGSGNPDFSDFVSDAPTEWRWVENYAEGPIYAFEVNGETYGGRLIDGVFQDEPDQVPLIARDPSVDYIAKHLWQSGFGTFDRPDVIDVKEAPFNAKGDGVTDDAAAIQAAIDFASLSDAPVFLSKGNFVVNAPLQLHHNTELFGISRAISILDARAMLSENLGEGGAAVVRSDDSRESHSAISDIKIMLPPSGQGIAGVHWQAGRHSILRDIWTIWPFGNDQNNAPVARGIITGNGGGRVYNWLCHSGFDTKNAATRNLIVDGTSEPLTFYMLHNQHMENPFGNRFEVRNASHISIYGGKHEDNENEGLPIPFYFENCDDVQVFGVSGLGKTREGRAYIEFHDSSNYSVCGVGRWNAGGTPESPHYFAQEYIDGEVVTQVISLKDLFLNELRRGHPDYTTGDQVEPTVFLTSPASGSVLEAGVPVELAAEARDSQSVALVEFYSDVADFLGDDDQAPYQIDWTPLQVGLHLLNAVGYDADETFSIASSALVEVTVVDTTPPVIESVEASPNTLWPPNHKMRDVELAAVGHDTAGNVSFSIVGVTSNEPIDAPGDGSTNPDWNITGPMQLELRAERAGPGNGRVYTIEVEAVDSAGNRTTDTVEVTVPSTGEVISTVQARLLEALERLWDLLKRLRR